MSCLWVVSVLAGSEQPLPLYPPQSFSLEKVWPGGSPWGVLSTGRESQGPFEDVQQHPKAWKQGALVGPCRSLPQMCSCPPTSSPACHMVTHLQTVAPDKLAVTEELKWIQSQIRANDGRRLSKARCEEKVRVMLMRKGPQGQELTGS